MVEIFKVAAGNESASQFECKSIKSLDFEKTIKLKKYCRSNFFKNSKRRINSRWLFYTLYSTSANSSSFLKNNTILNRL
jgi:hypothetical protein